MRSSRWLAGLLVLALLGSGCSLGRRYVGSPLQAEPNEFLVVGTTPKRDVLRLFGPPDRIVRQRDGDVFIYQFTQRNSSQLRLSEPVFTRFTFFVWDKVQDKSDRLMVFFDGTGVVSAYGYRHGRAELETL
jgi:hypothetical protein